MMNIENLEKSNMFDLEMTLNDEVVENDGFENVDFKDGGFEIEDEVDVDEEYDASELLADASITCNSSFKQYLNDIGTYKLLTKEEEIELGKTIKYGNEEEAKFAMSVLANSNLRLVVSIAKRYKNCGLDMLDIIQEGNCGLMKAASKYDYELGNRFSTYAVWWIKQAISRALAEQGKTIRIPVHMSEMIMTANRRRVALTQKLGYEPSIEEIAMDMNIPTKRLVDAYEFSKDVVSYDSPVGEDKEAVLGDFIEDTKYISPEEACVKDNLREKLERVFNKLSQKEEAVLKYRFGFYGRIYTLDEIGKMYNVTRERIRQIENTAKRKILRMKEAKELMDFLSGDLAS